METFLRHSVYTRCDPEYLCDLLRHISTESGDVPATETWKPTTTTTKATSKVWSKRRRSSSDDILHCWDDDRPQPLNSKHDLPLCNCAPFGKIYFIVRTAPAECRKARPISCRSRGQPCVSFLKFEAYNRRWESRVLTVAVSAIILTARSELREVLFWCCLWPFCLCMKYLRNCWTDLCQIDIDDVIGPSFGRVWRSRSKVKGQCHQGQKTGFSADIYRWTDLVLCSLRRVWKSKSKVKVTRDKNGIFGAIIFRVNVAQIRSAVPETFHTQTKNHRLTAPKTEPSAVHCMR